MKTICCELCHEIIIKNSRFLCYIFPVERNDVSSILSKIREEHTKASHCCYAYIYDEIKHFSDDGEPGGTAGMPILNVLEKEGLNHVLVVVVRYFGGIKLGAGGLVRAYTKSVTETLKIALCTEMIPGYKISLTFSYGDEKDILYILGKSSILDRQYLINITYICVVDDDIYSKLLVYQPIVLEKCYIKKLKS